MTRVLRPHVVILGAGVAGCIAALALLPSHRVTLLERQREPGSRPGECLPAAAQRILRPLGLWEEFKAQNHRESLGVQSYWGNPQVIIQDSLRNPEGGAWHLDRPAFESMLRHVAQVRGAQLLAPEGIAQAQWQAPYWRLTLNSGQRVDCEQVIDAGGRRAPFARKLGIERERLDNLVAAWAVFPDVALEGIDRVMARISAAPDGWWYSAPLPQQRRLLAFHSDKELLDTARWRRAAPFCAAARRHFPVADLIPGGADPLKGAYQGVTAANSSRLRQVAGPGWAAIGDAALSFDPLSSQGMYNAMASAMQLVALLESGDSVAERYTAQVEQIWAHYLGHRTQFYQMEQRWSEQPFWQARLYAREASTA